MSEFWLRLRMFWVEPRHLEHIEGCSSGAYVVTRNEINELIDIKVRDSNKEIERLTAIAAKHATRCDELYEALGDLLFCIDELNKLDNYELDSIEEINKAREVLDKSRTEADK